MKKLWEKFVAWLKTVVLPWAKAFVLKHWFMIINYFVIVVAYDIIYGKDDVIWAELLLGLWIFASIGIAGYRWFTKPKVK